MLVSSSKVRDFWNTPLFTVRLAIELTSSFSAVSVLPFLADELLLENIPCNLSTDDCEENKYLQKRFIFLIWHIVRYINKKLCILQIFSSYGSLHCVYLYNVSSHHVSISIPQVNVILWTMVYDEPRLARTY